MADCSYRNRDPIRLEMADCSYLNRDPIRLGKAVVSVGSHPANPSGARTQSSDGEKTTDLAFCEMVKSPQLYFDKPVRVTAILEQATEGQYLSDDDCVLSHDEQIGVGYLEENKDHTDLWNNNIDLESKYGGRAKVTVVGILRDSSRRDFVWYHYRFDIIRFDNVTHIRNQYAGELVARNSYVAEVRPDPSTGLGLVIQVRMPVHYAVRVEWTNLKEFPRLRLMGKDSKAQVLFSVESDEIRQMTANRWNRTVRCSIVSVE
jgi:hypothetical protein